MWTPNVWTPCSWTVASRTVRWYMSVVSATPSVVFCSGSPDVIRAHVGRARLTGSQQKRWAWGSQCHLQTRPQLSSSFSAREHTPLRTNTLCPKIPTFQLSYIYVNLVTIQACHCFDVSVVCSGYVTVSLYSFWSWAVCEHHSCTCPSAQCSKC